MPNIQIRDVPPGVHRRLKERAAASGQSLNEFLLARVEEAAGTPTLADFLSELKELGPATGPPIETIVQIIREDRDGGH